MIKLRAFVLHAKIATMLDDTATLDKYMHAAKNLVLEEHEKLEVQEKSERLLEFEEMIVSHL